jgi:hypothetical protein
MMIYAAKKLWKAVKTAARAASMQGSTEPRASVATRGDQRYGWHTVRIAGKPAKDEARTFRRDNSPQINGVNSYQ